MSDIGKMTASFETNISMALFNQKGSTIKKNAVKISNNLVFIGGIVDPCLYEKCGG